MRIRDWSSDVCSSDLATVIEPTEGIPQLVGPELRRRSRYWQVTPLHGSATRPRAAVVHHRSTDVWAGLSDLVPAAERSEERVVNELLGHIGVAGEKVGKPDERDATLLVEVDQRLRPAFLRHPWCARHDLHRDR